MLFWRVTEMCNVLNNNVYNSFYVPAGRWHQDPRSVGAIAGLAVAIIFTYRLMRSPATPPRRQPKRQAPTASSSSTSTQSNPTLTSSGVCLSSEDLRAQNVVDEFFQPVKVHIFYFLLPFDRLYSLLAWFVL